MTSSNTSIRVRNLNNFFISKVRIKILKYFLFNPETPIHLRALVRELQEEINAVRRELTKLEEVGFVILENRGNRKFYILNKEYFFLDELMGLFHKSFGVGGAVLRSIDKLGEVNFVILTGSFTYFTPPNKDIIDLIIIGSVNVDLITDIVVEAEKKLKREINYTVMKNSDFLLKKKRRDMFVMQLLLSKKILLAGKYEDLVA
jgi:DNA-binding transcriptional ArsR family regulator